MSCVRAAVPAALLLLCLLAPAAPALESGADRKLTTTGTLAEIGKSAFSADVAVNTRTGESLVVYTASPSNSSHLGVYGQRLSPQGVPVGPRLALSVYGEDLDPAFIAPEPQVAYSETSDTWLVVFSIDDQDFGRVNDKHEIFGRIVSGNGTVAPSLVQISETGALNDPDDDAEHPAVVWNPDRDEFLVAWSTNLLSAVGDTIRVQRISGTGTSLGADTQISSTGAPHGGAWATMRPRVAYDHVRHRYLVTWYAEQDPGDSLSEQEVFGQLLDGLAAPIAEVGPDDFRITVTGSDDAWGADAGFPHPAGSNPPADVVFDPVADRFLVAYWGDPATGGLAESEYEVFLQLVTPSGGRDGEAIRLSVTGPDGDSSYGAGHPSIAYDPRSREALVLWQADPGGSLAADELEIFGRRLIGGEPTGGTFRVGETGPDGDGSTDGTRPAIAAAGGRYQAVWDGRPTGTKMELYGDQIRVPAVSVGSVTAGEGDGVARVPVTVSHPDPEGVPITLPLGLEPGTAAPGLDLGFPAPELTIPARARSAVAEVPIVQDALVEPAESAFLTAGTPRGAWVAGPRGQITVTDDDGPGGGGGAPPPSPPRSQAGAGDPAKLQVLRARVRRGRLDVLASITARARGSVRVAYRAAGVTTRFSAPISGGRIRIDRRLPRAQRRVSTGIVTLTWAGDARVRRASVRLRAANGRALLRRTVTRISGRRLQVGGTISTRARGVVRITLESVVGGTVRTVSLRARIARGRWSASTTLADAVARAGGQVDIQFTGYGPRRIRGEQVSKAV